MHVLVFPVLVQGTVVDVVNVVSHVLEVVVTVASHDHILVRNRSLAHAATANHPVEKNPTVDHLKFAVLALTAEIRDLIDSMEFRVRDYLNILFIKYLLTIFILNCRFLKKYYFHFGNRQQQTKKRKQTKIH